MANRVRDAEKEQTWRGHFAAWRASGLGIRVYCDRYQLKEPSFYAWRRVLAKRDENCEVIASSTTSAQNHQSSAVARKPGIIPEPASALVELQLPCGAVLRIPRDVESMTLERILKTLQQVTAQRSDS